MPTVSKRTRRPVARPVRSDKNPAPAPWVRWIPWLIALLGFIGYTLVSVLYYRRYESTSWDLGIFDQGIRGYARMQAPISDIRAPGFNLLGDHFHPILILLAPIYALIPGALTILVAQAAALAVSAVPICRVAIAKLGPLAGTLIGVAYALSWGLQQVARFDFHEIAFGVPILAWSTVCLLERRWRAAALWAIALLAVKEELALTVVAIGLYIMVIGRRWKLGGLLAAGGAGAFLLLIGFVIPMFNPAGKYDHWDSGSAGRSPADLLKSLVSPVVKLHTLFMLLLPTAFLALASPLIFIAVPQVAVHFLSNSPNYWDTYWHYSGIQMPVLFAALVDSVVRLRGYSRRRAPAAQRYLAPATGAAVLLIGVWLCGRFPFGTLLDSAVYETPPRAATADALLAKVPDGASVESAIYPMPHLTDRARVYWLFNTAGRIPDYIALWAEPDPTAYAARMHPGVRYEVVGYDPTGLALLKRA